MTSNLQIANAGDYIVYHKDELVYSVIGADHLYVYTESGEQIKHGEYSIAKQLGNTNVYDKQEKAATLPLRDDNGIGETVVKLVLDELAKSAHRTAMDNGWHDQEVPFPQYIAMIHSEVSEALEAHRKGMGYDKIAEEFADVIIRIWDASIELGLELSTATLEKMEKNKCRGYRHGGLPY